MRRGSNEATVSDRRSRAPEVTLPPSKRATLRPTVKLTRAHLHLAARPAASLEAKEALAAVASMLSKQFATTVELSASLADATLHPFTHLAKHALFATFEVSGGLAVLELDAAAAGLVLHHAAGSLEEASPTALTRIEEAAMATVLLSALSTLRGSSFCTRYQPRLLGLHSRGDVLRLVPASARHLAVDVVLRIGERSGAFRVIAPSTVVLRGAAGFEPSRPSALAPSVAQATFLVECFVGHARLSEADREQLSVGDVVLFDDLSRVDGQLCGRTRLVGPTFTLAGGTTPSGFTPAPLESPMAGQHTEVSVDVEVELTRLRLSIAELNVLQTGAVLPLRLSASAPVTLRLGDKAIARAELVEIEGELGARVLVLL